MTPDIDHLDPDWDDVPAGWRAMDRKQVTVTDHETGEVGHGTLVIVPGYFGHRRRTRDGFYDQEDNDS